MANEKRLIDATRLEYWIDGVIHGAEVNGNAPTVNLYDVLTYLDGMPTVDATAGAAERRRIMSREMACVYYDDQKCRKFEEPGYVSWCVLGPCAHQLPSRADRIRAMTDEELAKLLYEIDGLGYCKNLPECGELLDADTGIPEEKCIGCMLQWLRQPAEEE